MGIEAFVGLAIAGVTGLSALTQKLHNRISELDKRIDTVELRVAADYVSKTELSDIMTRLEGHVARIENKLDRLVERG